MIRAFTSYGNIDGKVDIDPSEDGGNVDVHDIVRGSGNDNVSGSGDYGYVSVLDIGLYLDSALLEHDCFHIVIIVRVLFDLLGIFTACSEYGRNICEERTSCECADSGKY